MELATSLTYQAIGDEAADQDFCAVDRSQPVTQRLVNYFVPRASLTNEVTVKTSVATTTGAGGAP